MIDDRAITLDLLNTAKAEVMAYARAVNEAANPQLRDVLAKQLQKAQEAHERIFNFAKKKGYYNAYASPDQMLNGDIQNATQLLNQITNLR
ncbi:spore coat protein [Thermosediminibacter oceani]|uniref:spore coat protein n=1 Tax=Thermosediminibacter oceani TaxID=291990 RepID=UPI00031ABAB8|nr:spore coat protein [Thermosediminibacter oceani]